MCLLSGSPVRTIAGHPLFGRKVLIGNRIGLRCVVEGETTPEATVPTFGSYPRSQPVAQGVLSSRQPRGLLEHVGSPKHFGPREPLGWAHSSSLVSNASRSPEEIGSHSTPMKPCTSSAAVYAKAAGVRP